MIHDSILDISAPTNVISAYMTLEAFELMSQKYFAICMDHNSLTSLLSEEDKFGLRRKLANVTRNEKDLATI